MRTGNEAKQDSFLSYGYCTIILESTLFQNTFARVSPIHTFDAYQETFTKVLGNDPIVSQHR